MGRIGKRLLGAVALVALAAAVRGPLHWTTFDLQVSNDDAIPLLMARHILRGEFSTILWNQPYNGTLDAYLLAPFVGVFGHHLGFRLYEALCAALLALLAFALARRVGGEAAGWSGALLVTWGTPYMALMACTGPPPNFLMPLVTGWPLLFALRSFDLDVRPLSSRAVLGLGLVCGLAVWDSSLAIPAFAGIGAGLVACGFRPRRRTVTWSAGFVLGASPLLLARMIGASGARFDTAASAVSALRPLWLWGAGVRDLAGAVAGLFGIEVPLVIDGPQRAHLPNAALGVSLVLALLVASAIAVIRWRRSWPFAAWTVALGGAFLLSRRTGTDELRYLYGLTLPVLVLAGCGLAWLFRRRPIGAVALALALLVPWGLGHRALTRAWRDPRHAAEVWQVPRLDQAVSTVEGLGIRSAYASLQFAGRLTLESDERLVASQAWNERIPGDPLRFRDEVDLDPDAAWVLSRDLSRGMPRAGRFGELLRAIGGSCETTEAGPLVVFHSCRAPYDESRPVPPTAMHVAALTGRGPGPEILDEDPATHWTSSDGIGRGSGLAIGVDPARRLDAVVLSVDLADSPLAVPWTAFVDGEIVADGPLRYGLQWIGSAPRAGRQALLIVPLRGRRVSEVRLVFQGAGPRLAIGDVFAYGPDESVVPQTSAGEAGQALDAARRGDWSSATVAWERALRRNPERASLHAAWLRASWRRDRRRWLDVEGLDDGGPAMVMPRP